VSAGHGSGLRGGLRGGEDARRSLKKAPAGKAASVEQGGDGVALHAEPASYLGGVRVRERSDSAPRPRTFMPEQRAAHDALLICPHARQRSAGAGPPSSSSRVKPLARMARRTTAGESPRRALIA
jgi:hypothetical protein